MKAFRKDQEEGRSEQSPWGLLREATFLAALTTIVNYLERLLRLCLSYIGLWVFCDGFTRVLGDKA